VRKANIPPELQAATAIILYGGLKTKERLKLRLRPIQLRTAQFACDTMHLLRCSPSVDHSCLQAFDFMLRAAIQRITNSDLSDSQWLQASLPVKDGGLGVRRVISLALPAFLASAASTLSLQDRILSGSTCSNNRYFQSYMTTWSSRYGTVPETLPTKQPFWDRPALLADRAVVEANLNSLHQRAYYLSASSPHKVGGVAQW